MLITHHQAIGAVTAAENVGLDIPDTVRQAIAVRETVLSAGHTAAGTPAVPATPAAAHKALVDHGRHLMAARYTGQAAGEMAKHVDAAVARAVAAAVPAWLAELTHLYDAAAHRLTEDLTGVPSHVEQRDLGHIPRPVFASWLRCESAADNLDRIVECRNTIASAAGEEPIKNRRLLASITFPPPGDGRTWTQHHAPVLADWHDALKRPVERWRHLIRHDGFDLTLAALGEPHQRAEIRDQWRSRAQARHGRIMR